MTVIGRLERFTTAVNVATIALFVFSLLGAALFVPVFTDEVSAHIASGRLMDDGYQVINLLAACGIDGMTGTIPYFMYPMKLLENVVYRAIDHPFEIRLASLALLAIWIGQLAYFLPRAFPLIAQNKLLFAAAAAAFFSLGVMPAIMVLNRPEIFLLYGLTFFVFLPLLPRMDQSITRDVASAIILILATMMMFSMHFKQALFLVLFWVSIWFCIHNRALRWFTLLTVTVFVLWGVHSWQGRLLNCADEDVAAFTKTLMVPISDMIGEPLELILFLLVRLVDFKAISPLPYFDNALVHEIYNIRWNYHPIDIKPLQYIINAIAIIAYSLATVVIVIALIKALRGVWHTKTVSAPVALLLALIFSLACVSYLQGAKHVYETIYIMPVFAFALMIALVIVGWSPTISTLRSLSVLAGTAVIASQIMLYVLYSPMVPLIWSGKVVPDQQHFSMSVFNYDQTRADVRKVANMCEIDLSQQNRHMVMDSVTYLTLKDSVYQPLHALFLYYWWFDKDKRRDLAIAPFKPQGMIVHCKHMFPEYLGREKRSGDVCCMSAADLLPAN